MRISVLISLPLLLAALLLVPPLNGQEQASGEAPALQAGPLPRPAVFIPSQEQPASRVTPGGAFLRSLLVPGWGHAATGSYTRGGFYFLSQAGTVWMLAKTGSLGESARRSRDFHARTAELRFLAEGVASVDSLRVLVEGDPAVRDAQALVDSRSQQFEDWAALGIFLVLIGAADAFVAGHLQDFPAPLSIRAAPAGSFGIGSEGHSSFGVPGGAERIELRVSLPWKGPGRR